MGKIDLKKDRQLLRLLVNKNFSFADLDKRFIGVDSSTGNVFCPFHENSSSPSAKIYYDEDNEIFTLRCFRENRTFTAFDYVERILCAEKKRYRNVLEFLQEKLTKSDLLTQINNLSKNMSVLSESAIQKKIEYIDNVYNECESTADYIERLYTEQ